MLPKPQSYFDFTRSEMDKVDLNDQESTMTSTITIANAETPVSSQGVLRQALPLSEVQILLGSDATEWLNRHPMEKASYWRALLENDVRNFVANIHTQTGIVIDRSTAYPITINERSGDNAYPCSLRAQYVTYPLAELELVKSPWLRQTARIGLKSLNPALLFGQIDKVVQWNSWLLSTNMIPVTLPHSVAAVTQRLVERFPQHSILLKNVHARECPELPRILEDAGYDLITSRQVYFFDGREASFLQKSTVKRDRKLLEDLKDYTVMEHEDFTETNAPRVTELYKELYLDKHSRLNPQYTEQFVAGAIRERWLELRGLRHASGRIDGMFGCFQLGHTTSTPFIGYDTAVPQKTGLYRILVSMLLERVAKEKLLLNYSSGAGEFKRRRGGEPAIEFNAIYSQHLPAHRRGISSLLSRLSNRFGRRFLEENEV